MSSETIIEEIFKEEESEGTDWLKIIDKVDKILDKPSIKKIIDKILDRRFPDNNSEEPEIEAPGESMKNVTPGPEPEHESKKKGSIGAYMYAETFKMLKTLEKENKDMTVSEIISMLPLMKDSFIDGIDKEVKAKF